MKAALAAFSRSSRRSLSFPARATPRFTTRAALALHVPASRRPLETAQP